MNRYKSLTEEQKKALKSKGDEVDAEKTDELERPDGDDDSGNFNEISLDMYALNRVNLAKAFLGLDGGYSVRKMKKFMLRDKKRAQ